MSHMGGFGRRRGVAVAAIVLALCVAAPELGAGAATPTAGSTGAAAQPAANVVLVARHRTRAQRRKLHVLSFLRRHPNYLKRKFKAHPGQLTRILRKRTGKVAARPARRGATKKTKKKRKRVYVTAKAKKKRATAAKKKRRRRVAVAGVAAKKKKKGTTAASKKSEPLGWKGWLEVGLLLLAPFAAVALLLYITDWRRRPRAPSRSKRRRSLVITPLNKH